jgi:ubiquitin-protein ligase
MMQSGAAEGGGGASASTPAWLARISKEIQAMQKSGDDAQFLVSFRVVDDTSLSALEGSIAGPPGSLYEGGVWKVAIDIPEKYPITPPKFRLLAPIWHPQVSTTGHFCDILADKWSPAISIFTLLLSLQATIASPESAEFQVMNVEAAAQLSKDPKEFERTARKWARMYAFPVQARSKHSCCEWTLICAAHGVSLPPIAPLSSVVATPAFFAAEGVVANIVGGELSGAAADAALAETVLPVMLAIVSAEVIVCNGDNHGELIAASASRFSADSPPTRLSSFDLIIQETDVAGRATNALAALRAMSVREGGQPLSVGGADAPPSVMGAADSSSVAQSEAAAGAILFSLEFLCSCLDVLQQLLPRPRRSVLAPALPPPSPTLLAIADLVSGACGSALWSALSEPGFSTVKIEADKTRIASWAPLEAPKVSPKRNSRSLKSSSLKSRFAAFWQDAQAFADDGGGLVDATPPAFQPPMFAFAVGAKPASNVKETQPWLGRAVLEHAIETASLGLRDLFPRIHSEGSQAVLPLQIIRLYAENIGTTESLIVAFARCEDARSATAPRRIPSTRVVISALPPPAFFLPANAQQIFSGNPSCMKRSLATICLPESEHHISGFCKSTCAMHEGAAVVRDAKHLTDPVGIAAEFFDEDDAEAFVEALPEAVSALAAPDAATPAPVSREWLSLLRASLGLSQGRPLRAELDKFFDRAEKKTNGRWKACTAIVRSAARHAVETGAVDDALRAVEALTLLPQRSFRDKGLEADASKLLDIIRTSGSPTLTAAFSTPFGTLAPGTLSIERLLGALSPSPSSPCLSTGLPFDFVVLSDPAYARGPCGVCGCETRFADDGHRVCMCASCNDSSGAGLCLSFSITQRTPTQVSGVDDANLRRAIDVLYSGEAAAAARSCATELAQVFALRSLSREIVDAKAHGTPLAEVFTQLKAGFGTIHALVQALVDGRLAGQLREPLLGLLSVIADHNELLPLLIASKEEDCGSPTLCNGNLVPPAGSILAALNSFEDESTILSSAAGGKAGAAVAAAAAAVVSSFSISPLAKITQHINRAALAWGRALLFHGGRSPGGAPTGSSATDEGDGAGGGDGATPALTSFSRFNPDLSQLLSVAEVLGTVAAGTTAAVLPPRSKRAQNVLLRRRAGFTSVSDYHFVSRATQDEYVTAMLDHAFGESDGLAATSAFKSEAIPARTPKGLVKMIKELTQFSEESTTTTWESSIAVRIDTSRMDILRAAILPNGSTPYANGLLLFDIFVPCDYPAVPPKVHYITTGEGQARVNPNLYTSGKVCLSL